MKWALLAPLVCFAAAPAWALSNQYFCVSDQAVGFAYNAREHTWHPTMITSGRKYILRQLNVEDWKAHEAVLELQQPKPTMGFYEMGDGFPQAVCYIAKFLNTQQIVCEHVILDLSFSRDMTRFETTFRGSYTSDPTDIPPGAPPDTPFVEIGTCSPF